MDRKKITNYEIAEIDSVDNQGFSVYSDNVNVNDR